MVCNRCLLVVERILQACNIPHHQILLGELHINGEMSADQVELLSAELAKVGLQLIDKRSSNIIESIKQLVARKARNEVIEDDTNINLSQYLSKKLYHEYTYLSRLFSAAEGRTIESYFIEHRIQKVKELLTFNDMTLAAISLQMEYSSTAHLSKQFKQVTGYTPSNFKQVTAKMHYIPVCA